MLRLFVRSSPTLGTSVRAYSPRWLLYKSKTEGEKSTRSERSQESGVERVGWWSLSGWVADARGEVEGEREGGCTLEEAVVVRRQWERIENSRIEKGRRGTDEEESCERRPRGRGRDRAESERRRVEVGVKNPTRN